MNVIRKEFASKSARKKRLGQYLTGIQLAKLLAALAKAQQATSVLDPMAGYGDMLVACRELGARPEFIGAIEIDHVAHKYCAQRLKLLSPLLGNAFDFSILSLLPTLQWDLVITNPPYVRYQSMAKEVDASLKLPSATEIRKLLITAIKHLPNLDTQDKILFHQLCAKYSGLADLAVPSWILCASLVRLGGTLAVVVPDSWLNREYALPIHYMLLRWFRIRYIVEDVNAVWFDEALVKTNLLVAERIPRKNSAFDWANEGFMHIRLSKDAKDNHGVVSNIYPGTADSEVKFAQEANRWYDEHASASGKEFSAQWTSLSHMSDNLQRTCSSQRWLSILGESETFGRTNDIKIPAELSDWLGENAITNIFQSFNELGIHIGQGLRTGANRFFYVDCIDVSGDNAVISLSPVFRMPPVNVPRSCIAPVLRKQMELPDGYILKTSSLKGFVLALQNYALPEDMAKCRDYTEQAYKEAPTELAALIRAMSEANFGTKEEPKRIYELSAVAPNIRKPNQMLKNKAPRFWYMLPDFAARHTPDLFIPRVNYKHPKTFLNEGRASIIDANFSSIWLGEKSKIDVHALLAFLNSSWSLAAIEQSASVLGGGALKVEAAHLRKMPIPELNTADWKQLSNLGRRLTAHDSKGIGKVLDAIDKVIVSRLAGTLKTKERITQLRHLAQSYLKRRMGE